jgi:hypothetical protein
MGRRSWVLRPRTPVQQRWSETQCAFTRSASHFSRRRWSTFKGSVLPIDIDTPWRATGYLSATWSRT